MLAPILGRSVGSSERAARTASSWAKNAPPTQMIAHTTCTYLISSYIPLLAS